MQIQIWACTGGPNQQWTQTSSSTLSQNLTADGIAAVFPEDSTYSAATQAYNSRFTISPAAVAYPTNAQQVAAAVLAGTTLNMEVVAAAEEYHSYIANGLGGTSGSLVVDLSKMKAITVRAACTQCAGRAIPHGTYSYVGIGGLSGYGGFGFTSRAWGLTLDTIKSATVVLANGTIAMASSTVNTDLFWAIRGASPSFGIVTSIEVQTFPAPASAIVFQYGWNSMDITTASNAIASFQTFAASNILPSSGPSSGQVAVEWAGAWYGAASAFNTTLAPYLQTLPTPSWQTISPGSYINSVSVLSGQPLNTSTAAESPDTFYTKSLMTPSGSPMSAAAIKADSAWFVEVELYGGSNSAINAVPLDSTAFAKRDTLFTIQLYASSLNSMPPYPADGFTFLDGMAASIVSNSPTNWGYGTYLNYIDDRLTNASTLYYGSHYARCNMSCGLADFWSFSACPVLYDVQDQKSKLSKTR
ncbi:glucooligosaccharide oxidase [Mycena leptocephala]|nr:glucooligosaccharide oxidase [Mycena leptocephala]